MPKRVLKVFMQIDDTINGVTNADKKTMKKQNLNSFNKLKQKFRKYLESEGENEHTYLNQLTKYRENPTDSADELAPAEKNEAAPESKEVKEEIKEEVEEEEEVNKEVAEKKKTQKVEGQDAD